MLSALSDHPFFKSSFNLFILFSILFLFSAAVNKWLWSWSNSQGIGPYIELDPKYANSTLLARVTGDAIIRPKGEGQASRSLRQIKLLGRSA